MLQDDDNGSKQKCLPGLLGLHPALQVRWTAWLLESSGLRMSDDGCHVLHASQSLYERRIHYSFPKIGGPATGIPSWLFLPQES